MSDKESKPKPDQGDVTTQPAISTDEAAQTDEVLSPVGDEKTTLTGDTSEVPEDG